MATGDAAGRETADVSELRREVSFLCDASGVVVWADEPAMRLLGLHAGESLLSRAAPGTEDKLTRLLEQGAAGPVRDREACLLVEGTPQTLLVSLLRYPGQRVLLVGNLLPEPYSAVVRPTTLTTAPRSAALHGMSRSLVKATSVEVIVESTVTAPSLQTDEGTVLQDLKSGLRSTAADREVTGGG